jgi:amidohydrolase
MLYMNVPKDEILALTQKVLPGLIKLRRRFHRFPELSNREFETTALIKSQLKRHRIATVPLRAKTGVLAVINRSAGTAVAVRSDMDALPIEEQTSLPFRSRNTGVMHACGHDIHMAVVMGAAIILNKLKDKIPGCVKFIFQPAEETPPGGAGRLIEEGVMRGPKVKIIFGLHVEPALATGRISLRDGPMMASVTDFDVTVTGRSGHAAHPHRAVDAIAVTSEIIESMQKIISREISPLSPVVITFGMVHGGSARNVIADRVVLKGTARALSPEIRKLLPRLIKRTADGICRARNAHHKIDIIASYPVLSNNVNANRILKNTFEELFGTGLISEAPRTMGGEDFAFYLQKAPGAMFSLGTGNKRGGAYKPLHSSEFMADEASIYYGTALMSLAVCRYFDGM